MGSSLLVVIPDEKVSIALLLADGNKQVGTAMTELTAGRQPLLA